MSMFRDGGSYITLFKRHNLENMKGVIHVGAWDLHENDWYIPMCGSNVVWVEANPFSYEHVSKPKAETAGQKIYHFAACNVNDVNVNLYIPKDAIGVRITDGRSDCSSLAKNTAVGEGVPVAVPAKTLDKMVDDEDLDINNYDFLNIDTEGAELLVLEGFKNNLDKMKYVVVEITKNDRFNTNCSFETLNNYLTNKGFELKEVSDLIGGDWGDAFYVKK